MKVVLDTNVILRAISSKVDAFFQLNIIKIDPDDNKFVDCAFVGNAHYIVTDDKHFNVLKQIDFPKIPILTAEEFKQILA